MARIALLALGTLGDVLPYVALGKSLRAKGYDVTLATYDQDEYRKLALENGMDFSPVSIDVKAAFSGPEGQNYIRAANPFKFIELTRRVLYSEPAKIWREFSSAVEQSDAVIYSTASAIFGYSLAQAYQKPCISVALQPMAVDADNGHNSPLILRMANKVGIALFRLAGRMMLTRPVLREIKNDPSIPAYLRARIDPVAEPLSAAQRGEIPGLLAYSPSLSPRNPHWPSTVHVTGQLNVPKTGIFTPEPGLQSFLGSKEPIVYVGFGSMPETNPLDIYRTFHDATQKTGCKLLIATGWTKGYEDIAAAFRYDPNVIVIRGADHAWLFPRCDLIVHHGGVGTTHAAACAGRPSLVISHFFDQPYWAKELKKRGIGEHLPLAKLAKTSSEEVVGLFRKLLQPDYRERAENVARSIMRENGADAADVIDTYLSQGLGAIPAFRRKAPAPEGIFRKYCIRPVQAYGEKLLLGFIKKHIV